MKKPSNASIVTNYVLLIMMSSFDYTMSVIALQSKIQCLKTNDFQFHEQVDVCKATQDEYIYSHETLNEQVNTTKRNFKTSHN